MWTPCTPGGAPPLALVQSPFVSPVWCSRVAGTVSDRQLTRYFSSKFFSLVFPPMFIFFFSFETISNLHIVNFLIVPMMAVISPGKHFAF